MVREGSILGIFRPKYGKMLWEGSKLVSFWAHIRPNGMGGVKIGYFLGPSTAKWFGRGQNRVLLRPNIREKCMGGG
jgi:hypothetical protein